MNTNLQSTKLDNKVIFITGSSKGIGLAIAKSLKELTNSIIIISGTAPAAQNEMMGYFDRTFLDYNQVFYYPMNLKNAESINFVYNNLIEKFGKIDILINNAGIGIFKPFDDIYLDDLSNTMEVNFIAPVKLIKLALPSMIKNENGMVVNISSIAHFEKFKGSSIYAASKSALTNFSKVLREEVRSKNIKIMNVFPGATKTDIWSKESLDKYGEKMIDVNELGYVIANNIVMSYQYDLTIEDITIRPTNGDL